MFNVVTIHMYCNMDLAMRTRLWLKTYTSSKNTVRGKFWQNFKK